MFEHLFTVLIKSVVYALPVEAGNLYNGSSFAFMHTVI
jgi:hypothetical protein